MKRRDRTIMLPSLGLAVVLEGGRVAYQVRVSSDGRVAVINVALSDKRGGSASLRLENLMPSPRTTSAAMSRKK